MLKIIKSVSELKSFRQSYFDQGLNKTSVGFIPTMGSLHEGHFELIRSSKLSNAITIVSIFVNPAQFNNRTDFETYPNHIESDLHALRQLNVDAVFLPHEKDIYPLGYNLKLTENLDSLDLCGASRPGHFDGVLTVLLKLFNLVKPTHVYMGLKDYQQYYLVKKMTEDLFLDIQIQGIETVREKSGLALSSRNLNLKPEQKIIADQYAQIFASDLSLEAMKEELLKLDLKIDYLIEKWGRKFIAVYIGEVRLIDNRMTKLDSSINQNLLVGHGIRPSNSNSSSSSKKILFKMSGSIACYKACDVISKLAQMGHDIKVAATPDVFQFVGQATLEGLTRNKVYSDLYESGEMMSHIHLNDWCDMTVLCPATANTLTKVALGLSDNIITSLALSTDTKKPYLVYPAMNSRMLESKPLQTNLQLIAETHKKIIFGDSGHLACGHIGSGRLAEPSEILKSISDVLKDSEVKSNLKKGKILVTAGGTSEPIDPVRYITNTSSGDTGLKICESLIKDYEVYLLGSESMKGRLSEKLKTEIHLSSFKSFADLELKLKALLTEHEFEAVIHLAAVSDYSPSVLHFNESSIGLPTTEKISSNENFSIEFKKNKKLISEIKMHSLNPKVKVIGFKLLRTDDESKIQLEIDKILKDSDCVVVNSLENISERKHIYEIYNLSGLVFHGQSKDEMAQDISRILNGEVSL